MLVKTSVTLVIAAVALLSVACGGDGGEGHEGEDADIVQPPTTPNAVGAPCALGARRECKQTIAELNGIVSCYVGEQTCDAQATWGPCLKDKTKGNKKP